MTPSRGTLSLRARLLVLLISVTAAFLLIMGAVSTIVLSKRLGNEFKTQLVAAAGHTVGSHTWSHLDLSKKTVTFDTAKDEIEKGLSAVRWALGTPGAPFFRFPGFESTPATLDLLQSRGISVFSTDLLADDWIRRTPQQELNLLVKRLKLVNRGIILLHDPQATTAAMLPAFLHYLKTHNYRVVHLVPAKPAGEREASPH